MRRIVVLSLGAGVQSSTLLEMAALGVLPGAERPDVAVFADTHGEPRAVYKHLYWLSNWSRLNTKIIVSSKGDLQRDIMTSAIFKTRLSGRPPFYTRDKLTGKLGMMQRHCTRDYKIRVINRAIREMIGLKPRQKFPKDVIIEQWLGISTDEQERMRVSLDPRFVFRYPLIELGMSRDDCVNWSKENKMPDAPKSACKYCPFRSNKLWRVLKRDKDDWNDAIEFDKFLRNWGLREMNGYIYISAQKRSSLRRR